MHVVGSYYMDTPEIIVYPNQNITYHGSSSFSQPWSFLRHTWHWTRSWSTFVPQKTNPASATCKQTRNYTRHSAEVCLSGTNRLHIYMAENSVTICAILLHTHPNSHSTPFALNSALWPFILFQHPSLTAQKLTKPHICFQTLMSAHWFGLMNIFHPLHYSLPHTITTS